MVVGGVLVLAGAQCLYWLLGADLEYEFRDLLSGGNAAVVNERTRNAALLLAWFVVNAAVLGLYAFRTRGSGRATMAGLQVANLAYGVWLGITMVTSSCFADNSAALLPQPAAATVTLGLLYADWRRSDARAVAAAPRRYLLLSIGLLCMGLGALLYGWHLSILGIQVHSGTVIAVVDDSYGSTVTLDSLATPMYFDRDSFSGLPAIHQGDHLTVLTGDSPTCGYGVPLAIKVSGITYIDQFSSDEVGTFRPETWWLREVLRLTALIGGVGLAGLGLFVLLRWIG